jgi:hypothetical protein
MCLLYRECAGLGVGVNRGVTVVCVKVALGEGQALWRSQRVSFGCG